MNNNLDVENLIKSRRDTKNFLLKRISKEIFPKYLKWEYGLQTTE